MTTSIKFDKYLFNLAKRNDSCLTITAQTELESSLFESQPIELKRIKFDTVVAALSKQNEKNLITKVEYEAGPKNGSGKLLVSIVVRYDFLPEFSEQIILTERLLNENDSLKIKLISLENELNGIDRIMKSIEQDGIIKQSKDGELLLTKGKYLIQISGLYKGTHGNQKIEFVVEFGEKQADLIRLVQVTPYFLSAPYSYPYSITEVVEVPKDTKIHVTTKTSSHMFLNHLVSAKPIVN